MLLRCSVFMRVWNMFITQKFMKYASCHYIVIYYVSKNCDWVKRYSEILTLNTNCIFIYSGLTMMKNGFLYT
jgi:hypothetical protein